MPQPEQTGRLRGCLNVYVLLGLLLMLWLLGLIYVWLSAAETITLELGRLAQLNSDSLPSDREIVRAAGLLLSAGLVGLALYVMVRVLRREE